MRFATIVTVSALALTASARPSGLRRVRRSDVDIKNGQDGIALK